jgi:hypothetical protein
MLTSAKASGKASTSSGYPISSPSRTEHPISIPGEFVDKSIEIEPSAFISKLLDTNNYITTRELYKWAKKPNILLSDINIIIKSYQENVQKAFSYKNTYSHNKAILENTKLYNTKLEDNIKYYIAIVNRFIISLAISIPATLNLSLKDSELSPAYSCPGFPISHAFFRDTRVTKLPDLTLFTRNHIVFNNWLVQIKNKL